MAVNHSPPDQDERGTGPDIASLIDVCFLLLIYFIATTTIIPRESDLDMALPVPQPQPGMERIESLTIRIAADGVVSTGGDGGFRPADTDPAVRDLPHLRSQLELLAAASRAAGTTPVVRIDPDGSALQQRVIDVLNALAAAGIHSATFSDLVP